MPNDVILREVSESDLPLLFEHQLDPDANRMAAFPARDWDAFVTHWRKILADPSVTTKAILLDGQLVGNIVGFEESGRRQVGYWIGKSYWGRGVATKALAAFLDQVPSRPLYARVAKHNIGSIRVLEKCGFEVCGEVQGAPTADGVVVCELTLKLSAGSG